MVEIRRGMEGAAGGDRLPWLEPVEDEDEGRYPGESGGYGRLFGLVIVAAVAITALIAAFTWFRHHRAATADIGGVIHAPAGPYKVKPAESGGLRTDQVGEVASVTGAGEDIDGALDLGAVPEQPMIQHKAAHPAPAPQQGAAPAAQQPAPQQKPASEPKAMAPAAPPSAPLPRTVTAPPLPAAPPKAATPAAPPTATGGGGSIQLGAFSSEAKAKSAWKGLAGRFAFLHEMTMAIQPVQSGETTLYRLRASGGDSPAKLCARLKIAGETCAVVSER